MKKQEIYASYLAKIKEVLEKDDFAGIDYILEYIYTSGISEKVLAEIDDIFREITLYSELKEIEYKETALALIKEFEKSLKTK